MNLAENLCRMCEDLKNHHYRMMGYDHFTIYEPKKREIYAAQYSDRVLLHCVCDEVLAPLLGPRLIYDNAACQKGKGTHFALDRFSQFLREHYKTYGKKGYVLKYDIAQYFACIDYEVLKRKLRRVVKDSDVLDLLFQCIDSYESDRKAKTGLPLGNQSSQWFGIFYLDPLDRLIKEKLRVKYYVRYMDDGLLVHHDKAFLQYCLKQMKILIEDELHLQLNNKTQINPLYQGVEFLDWRFYLTDTRKVIRKLKRQSKVRMKRRIKKLQTDYAMGLVDVKNVMASLASYQGHLKHGNTFHWRAQ